jgi:ankyrin repeat protein
MSPLLWAVYGGYAEIVRILLDHGADPNFGSVTGESTLWHAEDDFGLVEIANLLRQHGATK